MLKKFLCVFLFFLSAFATSAELFAQRIKAYPPRLSSAQNYSYYRYHRRAVSSFRAVVSNFRAVESVRDYPYPVQTVDGGFRRPQRVASPPAQVFEEEIREEFRMWPSRLDAGETGSAGLDALEREVADLRNEVRELSRKIDLFLSCARQQQSDVKSEDAEKMERLKQELRELKALLEQLRKEK